MQTLPAGKIIETWRAILQLSQSRSKYKYSLLCHPLMLNDFIHGTVSVGDTLAVNWVET